HYFGGVTKALVPDNLKSAVTKADRYEPVINADFQDFANHYGCAVFPARSRKPQDKSLVEKTVSIVYSRIYAPIRNKVYHDLKTLNADIRHYLDIHNNTPFQKRPESRRELFDRDEKEALSPLPSERYEPKQKDMNPNSSSMPLSPKPPTYPLVPKNTIIPSPSGISAKRSKWSTQPVTFLFSTTGRGSPFITET